MAVALRQVERFEITLADGVTSDTHTLTTTLLDTGKAFLLYGWRCNGTQQFEANSFHGTVRISSTSQLTAARGGTDGDLTFVGYVCEFTDGVAVARGAQTMSGDGPVDIDVSGTITDLSKAWCRAHVRAAPATGLAGSEHFASGELIDNAGAVNLRIHYEHNGTDDVDVDWEVVQFDDCAVQRGSTFLGDNTTVDTLAISAIDQSRAFILAKLDQQDTGGASGRSERNMVRARFTANDQVTTDRGASGGSGDFAPNINVRIEVIEFTSGSGIAVQGVGSSFLAADGQNDEAISAVSALAAAAALCSVHGAYGLSSISGLLHEAFFTPDLTSATNLQLTRQNTAGDAAVEAYVIDFGAGGGGGGVVLSGPTFQGIGMGMG